jgi:hypothetical protein
MSSVSSTDEPKASRDTGMQPWHLFLLLAMVAATWAVIEARHTHPAALLLLSAAIIGAGAVAISTHYALSGFFGERSTARPPLKASTRQALEEEKALILRSIKELEFDRQMRKVGDADFEEIGGRLRARAVALIEQLDRPLVEGPRPVPAPKPAVPVCPSCDAVNDRDARFCKSCGTKLS